jgi:hypothetical protein
LAQARRHDPACARSRGCRDGVEAVGHSPTSDTCALLLAQLRQHAVDGGGVLFLPFLPMLPTQILLNNLL